MKFDVNSAEETQSFGALLGRLCVRGIVFTAEGTLGAGKTTLAQGVARGLDVPEDHYVNSPTFAIAQVHPGRLPFYHLDLYRIGDMDEAMGLGLEEMIGTDGVAFVEWPSQCRELIPEDHLSIRLAGSEEQRTIEIAPHGPLSQALFEQVCKSERA